MTSGFVLESVGEQARFKVIADRWMDGVLAHALLTKRDFLGANFHSLFPSLSSQVVRIETGKAKVD